MRYSSQKSHDVLIKSWFADEIGEYYGDNEYMDGRVYNHDMVEAAIGIRE